MADSSNETGSPESAVSRRDFLKTSAAATAASLLSTLPAGVGYAQGTDRIKVGVIGCGGRGTGATHDCANSSDGVVIWALGDVFKGRLDGCRDSLKQLGDAKVNVTDGRCFVGLDAYKGVLDSGVDMVILATPPGFRPVHFPAAIAAGKHVFMEKPVGTDAPGIRAILAAADQAQQKNLGVVAGTQRRHQASYVETIKRIHDGAIGDLVGAQVYWNGGGVGSGIDDRSKYQSDVEWMIAAWYQYTWLCGDHIVEQHVHNLDVANWVFNAHPVNAMGVGGRSQRTDLARFPMIYDHFAIDYEYPNGVHVMSMCRHWDGCPGNVSEKIVGTKGVANPGSEIQGSNAYRFSGSNPNPYVQEHTDLIASIRAGKPLNEGRQVAESTLTAIMGRMAAYTGQVIGWDQALNSQENLFPNAILTDPKAKIEVPGPAVPGKTRFS